MTTSPGVFSRRGASGSSKRNYWQAADALRQAVRLKPAEATYRQYLGLALMQTKRMHEAEEHLVEAARLEPNNPDALRQSRPGLPRPGGCTRRPARPLSGPCALDPRNEHARDELSDLPEEQPPGRKAESGGLLKSFSAKGRPAPGTRQGAGDVLDFPPLSRRTGRLAQWKSTVLTRQGSLVQAQ